MVDEIKGSIGDLTFQKNVSGHICHLKNKPKYAKKGSRIEINTIFSELSSQYKSLTDAQRNTWEQRASERLYVNHFDEQKSISGYNLFLQVNYYRELFSMSHFATAPSFVQRPTIQPISFLCDANYLKFETEDTNEDYYDAILIYCTKATFRKYSKQRDNFYLLKIDSLKSYITYELHKDYENKFNVSWCPYPLNNSFYLQLKIYVINKNNPYRNIPAILKCTIPYEE